MSGWWVASYIVLWILVVTLGVVVVALARQVGTLHLRLGPRGALEIDDEGPPLGEAPEPFEKPDLAGRSVTVGGPGRAQLLLFASPGCRMCEVVLPGLEAAARAGDLDPLVVTDVDAFETERAFARKRLAMPIIPAPEITQAYDIPGTPYVLVLDELGIVRGKGTVNNLEQMEGLVDTALRRAEQPIAEAH